MCVCVRQVFLNGATVLLSISNQSRWIEAGDAEMFGLSGAENRSCGPKEPSCQWGLYQSTMSV